MKRKALCGIFLIAICMTLVGCGAPKDAEFLELDTLYQDMSDNIAAAEKKYDKNYYKIEISVMNLETKYFSYKERVGNKMYSIDILMNQDELATLKDGQKITILGKFDIVDESYIKVKNAKLVSE